MIKSNLFLFLVLIQTRKKLKNTQSVSKQEDFNLFQSMEYLSNYEFQKCRNFFLVYSILSWASFEPMVPRVIRYAPEVEREFIVCANVEFVIYLS